MEYSVKSSRLTTYKYLYSEWNTLNFRHLSTKIHKNLKILKFLQKSQHCLLQKQIISRYRPNLIEKLAISNVNIFGIFAKSSQKLCNLVLINKIHNQNWNINSYKLKIMTEIDTVWKLDLSCEKSVINTKNINHCINQD